MVGFVLTSEQVRAAPPEVRAWLRALMEGELAAELHEHDRAPSPEQGLATCSPAEAAAMLQRIRDDYLTTQVFFEIGRDSPPGLPHPPQLHRMPIAEIMRHAQLPDFPHLAACLDRIAEAFRAVRGDPNAALLAFDQRGSCYVHEATHQSVRTLWHDVILAQRVTGPAPDAEPPTAAPGVPAYQAAVG